MRRFTAAIATIFIVLFFGSSAFAAGKSYVGYVDEFFEQEVRMSFLRLQDKQGHEILFLGGSWEFKPERVWDQCVNKALCDCVNKARDGGYPVKITGRVDKNGALVIDASVTCQKYTGQ